MRYLAVSALAFVFGASLVGVPGPGQVPNFLDKLPPRCIGPANMSGRIVEVAVYEKAPRIQYIASATGGLWRTVNHGVTFQPVFERQATVSLGAVAVNQNNPDIVWVGTGEGNDDVSAGASPLIISSLRNFIAILPSLVRAILRGLCRPSPARSR